MFDTNKHYTIETKFPTFINASAASICEIFLFLGLINSANRNNADTSGQAKYIILSLFHNKYNINNNVITGRHFRRNPNSR